MCVKLANKLEHHLVHYLYIVICIQSSQDNMSILLKTSWEICRKTCQLGPFANKKGCRVFHYQRCFGFVLLHWLMCIPWFVLYMCVLCLLCAHDLILLYVYIYIYMLYWHNPPLVGVFRVLTFPSPKPESWSNNGKSDQKQRGKPCRTCLDHPQVRTNVEKFLPQLKDDPQNHGTSSRSHHRRSLRLTWQFQEIFTGVHSFVPLVLPG